MNDKSRSGRNAEILDEDVIPVEEIPEPPDGGYGWVIVFASFAMNAILDGVSFNFGMFFNEFKDYFDISKAKTSLIGSTLVGTCLLVGPIVAALVNKFGSRPIAMTGGFVASVAFFLCTFTKDINVMVLTYGICGGLGFGCLYLPSFVSVGYYFERRRAFATGLAVCGSGVGTFLMALVCRGLLGHYDWKNAMYVISGITLNLVVCGSLLRPLEMPTSLLLDNYDLYSVYESDESDEFEVEIIEPNNRLPVSIGGNRRAFSVANPKHIAANSVTWNRTQKRTISERSNPRRTNSEARSFASRSSRMRLNAALSKSIKLPSATSYLQVEDVIRRPLYRKDIFFSGSVYNLRQFQVNPTVREYLTSITSIPDSLDKACCDCSCCHVLPDPIRYAILEMLDPSLLKDFSFILILLANMFAFMAMCLPYTYLRLRALSLGLTDGHVVLFLSITGATNTFGRIAFGYLADLPQFSALTINNIACLVFTIINFVFPFFKDPFSLAFYAGVFGLFSAAHLALTSVILCDLLGLQKLTNAFGLLCLIRGISAVFSPPIAGLIYDMTGDSMTPFLFAASCSAIASCFFLLLQAPCLKKYLTTHNPKSDDNSF